MALLKFAKAPEAPYQHQSYPKTLFNRDKTGAVISTVIHTKEEHDAIAPAGWVESPAELAPSSDKPEVYDEDTVDGILNENDMLKKQVAELLAFKKSMTEGADDPAAAPLKDGKKK